MTAIIYGTLPYPNTVIHILRIDLRAVRFIVTPAMSNSLPARRTSEFMDEYGQDAAINGDQFVWIVNQDRVKVTGFAACGGFVYSTSRAEGTLFISKKNQVSFNQYHKAYHAISFNHFLVLKGKPAPGLDKDFLAARTIIAMPKDKNTMLWYVVDGIEGQSGMTLAEAADFLVSQGIERAVNMDGGGSTTLAMRGRGVVNTPADDNIPRRERPVANHLGVRAI